MRLTVLGSGSRGNALLVEGDDAALLVDAGFSHRDLVRRCAAAGCDAGRIRAIALTHEHGDHARGAARAAAAWGVPVAASRGTLEALADQFGADVATCELGPARRTPLAGFHVTAYPSAHDAADPVLLLVEDGAGRRLGIAYDVGSPTVALRHALLRLDALVIEANHDEVLLRASGYPPSVRARIAGRGGHLSNREAGELAAGCAHGGLGLLVLAHVSETCNRAELAEAAVRAALRGSSFAGRIVVAGQNDPSPTLEVGAVDGQLALPLPLR